MGARVQNNLGGKIKMRKINKPTKLLSTFCKRCQWFENKTSAKERGVHISPDSFGLCRCGDGMELTDRQVLNGPVPCQHYMYKPCSGSGDSYMVFNVQTGTVHFFSPIAAEAKAVAAKFNKPEIIAVKLTKVK